MKHNSSVLIFDLDNTLINRNKCYYSWLQELLKNKNLSDLDWQKIYTKDDWGYCDRISFYNWLIHHFELKENPDFFIDKCAAELQYFIVKDILVLELLIRLSLKHEIVIATNGGIVNQMNKLKSSGILDVVKEENIIISAAIKTKKPAMKFYKLIESKFSKEAMFIMIGDDPINDILGAKKCHWQTVWLSYDRKISLDTDYIIKDIFTLERLLEC